MAQLDVKNKIKFLTTVENMSYRFSEEIARVANEDNPDILKPLNPFPNLETDAGLLYDLMNPETGNLTVDKFNKFASENPDIMAPLGLTLEKKDGKSKFLFAENSLGLFIQKALENSPQGLNRKDFSSITAQAICVFSKTLNESKTPSQILKEGRTTIIPAELQADFVQLGQIMKKAAIQAEKIPEGSRISIMQRKFLELDTNRDGKYNFEEIKKAVEEIKKNPDEYLLKPQDLPKPKSASVEKPAKQLV